MCEVWFVVVWCQDCFFFSILGLLLLFFVAVYWSTGWFRALLEAHLVKISPSTFRELTQHQEKQDMLAQALSQWAHISFLLMALRCQIPVLNSFYWSSKPVDCVTVADTVCIWGHYFFFRLLNSRSKLEAGKKIFLEICTRDAYSAFTLDHYLIQGTFTSPSGTFQSFGLSEYSECTLDSGQGGGAAVPSNVYTSSQMGAI